MLGTEGGVFHSVLVNHCQTVGIRQAVRSPTRFRANHRPSLLYLVYVNNSANICRLDHLPPLYLRDHCVLRVDVEGSRPVLPAATVVKQYNRLNEAEAMPLARDLDWGIHGTVS